MWSRGKRTFRLSRGQLYLWVAVVGCVLSAVASASSPVARRGPTFELAVAPGLTALVAELSNFEGADINERGQVVGTAGDANGRFKAAARFTPGVGLEDLDPDGEYSSSGHAINTSGTVLGFSEFRGQTVTGIPFLYRDGAGFDFLERGRPQGILDGGLIPGFRVRGSLRDSETIFGSVLTTEPQTGESELRPYIHTKRGGWEGLTGLHPRFAEELTFGAFMNGAGFQVFVLVGRSRPGEEGAQEYLMRTPRGRFHEVVSPGRPVTPGSRPNRRGRMAGNYKTTEEAHERAYVWTRKGGLVSIHPADFAESAALGVNKGGLSYGILKRKKKWSDVFVHSDTEGLRIVVSREELVEVARSHPGRFAGVTATDMNNRGEIVGCVLMSGGPARAYYYGPKYGFHLLAGSIAELEPGVAERSCSVPLINEARQILVGVRAGSRKTMGVLSIVD